MSSQRLESNIDLYTDRALDNPYPIYKELRDMGGPVWLKKYGWYALTLYDNVKEALGNPVVFSSASGVTMNDKMNGLISGGLLCSDSTRHDVLRKIIEKPLLPKQLNELRTEIMEEGAKHVAKLVEKDHFEVVTELARHLPTTIVSNLVGLPVSGRERMLAWAPANFDCFGPIESERTQEAFPIVDEMVKYCFEECTPQKLKPGSWASQIWEAADRGEISHEECPYLMNDYLGPALDTTIFAISSAIWLFAEHPEQWKILRQKPSLIPNAINEVIRLESPIQHFSRVTTQDYEMNGHTIPKGSRVLVAYGSANRDDHHWVNPDEFNIQRKDSAGHLGFGFGEHQCVGNNLARLEMRSLLTALLEHIERFELINVEWARNSVLHGISRCDVRLHKSPK